MRKILIVSSLALFSLSIAGLIQGCNAVRHMEDASETAFQQTKVSTLLEKYEWFKDAYASLSAKKANIEQYRNAIASMKKRYGDDVSKWSEDAAARYDQKDNELSAMIGSFNGLAADYNSAMSKLNYRFTNVGDLPVGATEPLPREVAPYITE